MKFLHFVLIQHKSAGIEKRFGSQVIALGRGHVRGLPLATKRFIIDATPGAGAHGQATGRKSADKRTKPRSSEVGSRRPEGKAALRNFREVPGRSTVITRLQKARTTTYSDAAKFRTVSRIARCIRSAVRLPICLTRASSIKASAVYRRRTVTRSRHRRFE